MEKKSNDNLNTSSSNVNIENNKKPTLVEPLNWTDPIIYHDPNNKINKSVVIKLYSPDFPDLNESNSTTNNATFDNTKVEGIFIPIIKLNNIVIDKQNILSMNLDYTGFTPKLSLYIRDYNSLIKFKDVPGQNNVITIILLSPVDGVYKKISLDFVITSWNQLDEEILAYYGTYKLLSLNQSKFEGIIYNGCANKECNTEKQVYANTWETLHEISKKIGLGFASTDKCKDVQDRLPRLLQNINYYDYINSIIEYSGVDLNSMFDCWIDLYGYLVMVNVSWVMNEQIKPENLSIIANKGVIPTNSNTQKQSTEEVIRSITNFKTTKTMSNMEFYYIEQISYPGVFYNNKSLKTYNIFRPEGVNNNTNVLSQEQIQVVEDSIDGKHIEDYETSEIYPTYFEFNNYDVSQQRAKREMYFMKLRSNKLKVYMKTINFGLQRGTLINLDVFEYDPDKKITILTSSSNLFSENNEVNTDIDLSKTEYKKIIENNSFGLINPASSGLYYIDGMEIIYDKENGKLAQILYLLKRGNNLNYANKYTTGKYGHNNVQ